MRNSSNALPTWVKAIALFFGVLSTVAGLAIMIDPSIMSIDDTVVGRQWGGRNMGIGVGLLIAVALRSPHAYLAALGAGLFRDIGDLVGSIEDGAAPVVPIVALLLGAAAIVGVLRSGAVHKIPTTSDVVSPA